MRKTESDATWLAPVLERNLGEVRAPDELWNRIRNPRPARPRRAWVLTPLPVLGIIAIATAAAWSFVPRRSVPSGDTALALQALALAPENLELTSGTIPEIRAWVTSRTGMDLPLPAETSRVVRLKGVCAVKGGTPTIEVAYRVGGHDAALLVSRASAGSAEGGKHRFLKCDSTGGARVSSWVMRGQLYTLAYAGRGDLRDECLLCHSVAGPATVVN